MPNTVTLDDCEGDVWDAMATQPLHRSLSTDFMVRKRPVAMKLR
jgi:hypothetical protein